jgi:hypothetical protein
MHPGLTARFLDRHERAKLARVLGAGPWCWPREDDPPALERARAAAGRHDPPPPRPGTALLVAVDERSESLWWRDPAAPGRDAAEGIVGFGGEARRSWDLASPLVSRSVPVLWRSVAAAHARPPLARHLAPLCRRGATAIPKAELDGPSFGLSLFLALASEVLEVAADPAAAASATIDASGRLGPVDELPRKIRAVAKACPRIARFFVFHDQAAEARRAADAAGRPIEIVPVRTVAEAVGHALPGLRAVLAARWRELSTARRAEFARSFFRFALGPRAAVVDWEPVAAAAEVMLEEPGRDLDDDTRRALDCARRIALRHAGNQGTPPIADEGWLARVPQPFRLDLVAQIVQQAADTARTDEEAAHAEALARRHLVPAIDAFEGHLRIQGALARLLAVTGRPEEALDLAAAAAGGWLERGHADEVSHPLCLWIRLAGDLVRPAAFEAALDTVEEARTLGSLGGAAAGYVRLARGRALIRLGRPAEARPLLAAVAEDTTLPDHLHLSAGRWLARTREANGSGAPVGALQGSEPLPGARESVRRRYRALLDLDRAVAAGNEPEAAGALDRLRALQPGIVGLLERAAGGRGGLERAAYVGWWFPY